MIVANMATYPARQEALKNAVARLSPQVDKMNIVLNEYSSIPEWLIEFPNVHAVIPTEDYKDIAKFLPAVAPEDIVLLVDDDLLYSADYVQHMIGEASKAKLISGEGGIGGLHGTIYRPWWHERNLRVIARVIYHGAWRTGSFRTALNYWEGLKNPVQVEQIGTGTAILPGYLMPELSFMVSGKRRADVRLAEWAYRKNIPIVALPRSANWLTSNEQDETIYSSYTRRMPEELSREISVFAMKVSGAGKLWLK